MKRIKKLRSSMVFNLIGTVIILLFAFSIIVSTIGYVSFTNAFKREYAVTTYHMADTATLLVNGDHIDEYLATDGASEEYQKSKTNLDAYCEKMNVSIVYVIKVDTTDYGRFTSIFNSVGSDTPYSPWEIGYQQDTTNEEYVSIYKDIYENGLEYGTVYRTKDLKGAPPHVTTLVPVKDSNGDVVSIMCIQRPMSELDTVRRGYMIRVGFTALGIAVFVAIFYALLSEKRFVKPVKKISDEATRFAKENTKGEPLGDVSKFAEISNLAHSIDKMETDMLSYIENLTSATAEKERIGAELSIASTIQENSIPNIFPAFPHRDDFEIYASMEPAKEVGGDFYNFYLIDDEHIAVTIADVSGKGIPAALFMMVTNILISDRTYMGGTPAEILTFVNQQICEHNQADMFVTVWLGIVDLKTGKLTAANAGHDDAAVYRKGGEFEIVKSRHGLVIGAMEGVQYKDFEIQLNEGDKLFLYTDGVPEATDKDNNMFAIERMIDALNEYKELRPTEILEGVKAKVDDFVGDSPQFDDLTMLCFEYKKKSGNTLTVAAEVAELDNVIGFVDRFLEENGCSMKDQMKIDLSLEEAFVNVANYAYGDGRGMADISVKKEGGEVTIILSDSGTPYNPLEKEDPDITLSAEERKIGGLGVFLVKKNMDTVTYEYKDGKNILTMKKTI